MRKDMRRFFAFWWECARTAFKGNSAFANDWQWLVGYPTTAVILWIIGYFYAELSGKIEVTLTTGALGALGAAAIAYFITWLAAFVVRFLNQPAQLFDEQKSRADRLQERLEQISNDPAALERKNFVDHAFLGFGDAEIEWLERMDISGRPTGILDSIWIPLERSGLVERDFTGPKGIKDELKAAVRSRLAEQRSLANALEIVVGQGSKYQTTNRRNANCTTQAVSIGVRNSHPKRFITNCKFYLRFAENVEPNLYLLEDSFTLIAGEERIIPISYHYDYVEKSPQLLDQIRFSVKIPGGFWGVKAPKLPIGTHIITLRATSTETRPCEVRCNIWVDEQRKLRLEKIP